jgi:hypothetical protein
MVETSTNEKIRRRPLIHRLIWAQYYELKTTLADYYHYCTLSHITFFVYSPAYS